MAIPKLITALLVIPPKDRKHLPQFAQLPQYRLKPGKTRFEVLKKLVKKSNEQLIQMTNEDIDSLYKKQERNIKDSNIPVKNTKLLQLVRSYQQFLMLQGGQEEAPNANLFISLREAMTFAHTTNQIIALGQEFNQNLFDEFEPLLNDAEKSLEKLTQPEENKRVQLFAQYLIKEASLAQFQRIGIGLEHRTEILQEMWERVQQFCRITSQYIGLGLAQTYRAQHDVEKLDELLEQAQENIKDGDIAGRIYYLTLQSYRTTTEELLRDLFELVKQGAEKGVPEDLKSQAWLSLLNASRRYHILKKTKVSETLALAIFTEAEKLPKIKPRLYDYPVINFMVGLFSQSNDPNRRKRAKPYFEEYAREAPSHEAAILTAKGMLYFLEGRFEEILALHQQLRTKPRFAYGMLLRFLELLSYYELESDNPSFEDFLHSKIEQSRSNLHYHKEDPAMTKNQDKSLQDFIRWLKNLAKIKTATAAPKAERKKALEAIVEEIHRAEPFYYKNWLLQKIAVVLAQL